MKKEPQCIVHSVLFFDNVISRFTGFFKPDGAVFV